MDKEQAPTWVHMTGLATAVAFILGSGVVVDSNYGTTKAEEYVEQSGYTNIEFIDKDLFFVGVRGCSKADWASYEFTAQAPSEVEAHILVCKGILKSATLRQAN